MQVNNLIIDRLSKIGDKLIYSEENVHIKCSCTYNEHPELIGKKYSWTKKCEHCGGTGKIKGLRSGKTINKKCPVCGGNGYNRLDEPIIHGNCTVCDGLLYHSKVNTCDNVSKKDIELLLNLIDFDNVHISKQSTFNEEYLGIGIVGGVTDYGRYLNLNPDEYKESVIKSFRDGYHQYISFLNRKTSEVCNIIKINKTPSGWSLYPIFL